MTGYPAAKRPARRCWSFLTIVVNSLIGTYLRPSVTGAVADLDRLPVRDPSTSTALISPLPRAMRRPGISRRSGAPVPPAIRRNNSSAPCRPISWPSLAITVTGVGSMVASSKSSNPTTARRASAARNRAQRADAIAVVLCETAVGGGSTFSSSYVCCSAASTVRDVSSCNGSPRKQIRRWPKEISCSTARRAPARFSDRTASVFKLTLLSPSRHRPRSAPSQ